jgi:dihydrofolate reductase
MAKVVAHMSMSLDGFIEHGPGEVELLFEWLTTGERSIATESEVELSMSPSDAEHFEEAVQHTTALVCGRKLFDLTKGWGGRHPTGAAVYVVTHHPPEDFPDPQSCFTFVTDGVASAVEQAIQCAGDGTVAIASADIARQCLDLGLLDAIAVDLVPVVLGSGTPFLAGIASPVRLGEPTVTPGIGVTHLSHPVLGRADATTYRTPRRRSSQSRA